MTSALRAGLLGIGMMGRNHARVLSQLDGVDFVAAADPIGDKVDLVHGPPLFPDIESLIAQGIDICVVAVPTVFHLEAGLALADAGIHTLVEKPLATDVTEASKLADAFERAGVVGCVGHIERYNPSLRALRARLDDGALGEVYQVATRRQGPFPNRISDVGVVKDLATHDIDLTSWVMRQPYRSVAAQAAYKSGRAHEDLIAVVATMADGTAVNHLVNWLSPMKERVTVVTGERGCFVADTLAADLTYFENGVVPTEWDRVASFRGVSEGNMTRFAIPKPEPLRTELEAFRDAVLGKDSDIVTMAQGVATVAVAAACVASAAEQRTILLNVPESR